MVGMAGARTEGAGLMLPCMRSDGPWGTGEGCAEVSALIDSSPAASRDIALGAGRTAGSRLLRGGRSLFFAQSSSSMA